MTHSTTPQFWELYGVLPERIRRLADKNFGLLKANTSHPSLQFKKIDELWSARVGTHYRALAFEHEGGLLWFWIGPHAEYDHIVS